MVPTLLFDLLSEQSWLDLSQKQLLKVHHHLYFVHKSPINFQTKHKIIMSAMSHAIFVEPPQYIFYFNLSLTDGTKCYDVPVQQNVCAKQAFKHAIPF